MIASSSSSSSFYVSDVRHSTPTPWHMHPNSIVVMDEDGKIPQRLVCFAVVVSVVVGVVCEVPCCCCCCCCCCREVVDSNASVGRMRSVPPEIDDESSIGRVHQAHYFDMMSQRRRRHCCCCCGGGGGDFYHFHIPPWPAPQVSTMPVVLVLTMLLLPAVLLILVVSKTTMVVHDDNIVVHGMMAGIAIVFVPHRRVWE